MTGAVLVLAAFAALAQEKEILLEAPAGVNDQDRLKAAKTLAIRCAAAGLKDIVADLHRPSPNEPKRIRLVSKERFWTDQHPLLDFLASFKGQVEIRFHRPVREHERAAYPEGGKAPDGYRWVKVPEWKPESKPFLHYKRVEESMFLLVAEKPKSLAGPFKIIRHAEGELFGSETDPAYFMLFKGPQAVELDKAKVRAEKGDGHILPLCLFIDDAYLPENNGMMHWRYGENTQKPELALWRFDELNPKTPLAWLLENPLPFELKRVKRE